jgi:DNA-binding response OmpR family regulator
MKLMAVTSDQEVLNTLKEGNLPNNWNLSLVTDQVDPVDLLVKIHAFNPFAILIDDSLFEPKTNSLLLSIREIQKSIQIIFVTENDSIELGREIAQLGIHKYFIKPFSMAHLLESIKSLETLQNKKAIY